jgi:hypothetical protein
MIAKHNARPLFDGLGESRENAPNPLAFVMCPVFGFTADAMSKLQPAYAWAYAQALIRANQSAWKWPADPTWN